LNVLVVDDDAAVRNLLRTAFLDAGNYEMDEASSGTGALIKLGSRPPDLLILDLFLPGVDGRELCRIIGERPELSGMKVIVITGHSDDPKVEEIRQMGFTHIYGKPLDVETFIGDVQRLMG